MNEPIICYDGLNPFFANFNYKLLKVELEKLDIVGYIYYGMDTIPEQTYRHCYSFLIYVNNDTSKNLWTNRKRIQEQILNYLRKRMKKE